MSTNAYSKESFGFNLAFPEGWFPQGFITAVILKTTHSTAGKSSRPWLAQVLRSACGPDPVVDGTIYCQKPAWWFLLPHHPRQRGYTRVPLVEWSVAMQLWPNTDLHPAGWILPLLCRAMLIPVQAVLCCTGKHGSRLRQSDLLPDGQLLPPPIFWPQVTGIQVCIAPHTLRAISGQVLLVVL